MPLNPTNQPSKTQEDFSKPSSAVGIDTCAISLLKYSESFLKRTMEELRQMERTRKINDSAQHFTSEKWHSSSALKYIKKQRKLLTVISIET